MASIRSRRYDEREVATILERAADLEGAALVPTAGGRSLEEIKSIAVEAGFDAAAVEAAARSIPEENVERWPALGRAPRMELTSSVTGVLDDDGRRQLVGILQRAVDAKGRTRETAQTLEWRHLGLLGREMVVVTARRGRTHLEVRGRYRRGMVASFIAGGVAGGLASAGLIELLHLSSFLGDWAAPMVLAPAFASGRTVWSWFSGLRERALRRLAARATEVVDDEAVKPEPPMPPQLP